MRRGAARDQLDTNANHQRVADLADHQKLFKGLLSC
jgi:hypothetical protein